MANIVLERLRAERQEQIYTMESILNQVSDRDLSEAEESILNHTRDRLQEIDKQIEPLEAYEAVKAAHQQTVADLPQPRPTDRNHPAVPDRVPAEPRRVDGQDRAPHYNSPGAYIVDLIRAGGYMRPGDQPDPLAQARVQQTRVVANQTTGDTPGLLPEPIVGQVVSLIDADRPLISSLGGAMPLGNIPGTSFTRPKVTQHTQVGRQTAEKTELASRKMIVTPVPFAKETYGGTVDISRQDIDWTNPAAWDILIRDLASVYSFQTETVIATAFRTVAVGNTAVAVADDSLAAWAKALYTAAAASYRANFKMPDRVWCSLDVWAALGALVDVARLVMPPSQTEQPAGSASLASFMGDVIGLPRIVVPTFAAGTCIVGNSTLYEAYEEVIGLLSVVEPSILGVTVAYGGYVAYGAVEGTGLIPLTAPAGMTEVEAASLDGPPEETETHNRRARSES
jgi:HK97 family phage major capsid protein